VQAASALAEAARTHAEAQQEHVRRLDATPNGGDARCEAVLDAVWYALAEIYAPLREVETTWNELAVRVADTCGKDPMV
jgi:hypothetical protein